MLTHMNKPKTVGTTKLEMTPSEMTSSPCPRQVGSDFAIRRKLGSWNCDILLKEKSKFIEDASVGVEESSTRDKKSRESRMAPGSGSAEGVLQQDDRGVVTGNKSTAGEWLRVDRGGDGEEMRWCSSRVGASITSGLNMSMRFVKSSSMSWVQQWMNEASDKRYSHKQPSTDLVSHKGRNWI